MTLQALGTLHEECLSVKVKTQQKKLQSAMQQLLRSVQTSCCPSYSAAALLRALSHVNGQVSAGTHLHIQNTSSASCPSQGCCM